MTSTVAFIFARGGSKGLPGKNIRQIGGRPLIAHTIGFAKSCSEISDVIVSTDDRDIAQIAENWGATVPFMRPQELATDSAPERLAWRHAIEFYRDKIGPFDNFLSLPAVSPLRESDDIPRVLQCLKSTEADLVLSAVESESSPYTNLLEKTPSGFQLCSRGKTTNRQEAPKVFRIVPMYYACRPESVFRLDNIFDGKVEIIEIPKHRAVDVDTIEDFDYLEFLFNRNAKDPRSADRMESFPSVR